jgi:2-furoyl-CoA dehydrogenase large subunit
MDYCAVDDCGVMINPRIVEGQVHGATAHGIGAALMENCAYDDSGNMVASTFSEYTPITSLNIPDIKYANIETPSPHSYSGAKGMGEGGAAPVHAISAALQDALFAQGIYITESFNNGDSIFRSLAARREGRYAAGVSTERKSS